MPLMKVERGRISLTKIQSFIQISHQNGIIKSAYKFLATESKHSSIKHLAPGEK